MMIHAHRRLTMQHALFAALLVVCTVLNLWKAPKGLGGIDEAFYLATPYRLTFGDALLSEEWHVSQLSAFLLYPLVRFVLLLRGGSTEGIVLLFRYIYVLFQTAAACTLYALYYRRGLISVAASLFFYLFSPLSLMALSYNSMGLMLAGVSFALMATAAPQSPAMRFFLCGILFACAVLCVPYLALGYGLYSLLCFLFSRFSNQPLPQEVLFSFSGRVWRAFTCGILLCAGCFFLFVFSRCTLQDIVQNIRYIVTDAEHPLISPVRRLRQFTDILMWEYPSWFFPCLALFALCVFDRRSPARRMLVFIAAVLVITLRLARLYTPLYMNYEFILIPLPFLGLIAYFLAQRRDHRTFFLFYLPGLFFTLCLFWGSNQGMHAIAIGSILPGFASLLLARHYLSEALISQQSAPWLGRVALICFAGLLFVQLGEQTAVKLTHAHWEDSIPRMDAAVSAGPLKGLQAQRPHVEAHEAQLRDLAIFEGEEPGRFLALSNETWPYLAVRMPVGSFSCWPSGAVVHTLDRWDTYFSLHPQMTPRYVYLPFSFFEALCEDEASLLLGARTQGYGVTRGEAGYLLTRDESPQT